MPRLLPLVVFTALGVYGLVLLVSSTPKGHQVGRWLWRLGKGHRIVFAYDAQGQLADGPEIASILTSVAMRIARAKGVLYLCVAMSLTIVVIGPTPSQSTFVSVAASVLLATAAVAPPLILRPLLQPLASVEGVPPRVATTEDYVAPWLHALLWIATAGALVLPVTAAAMASTAWYDAGLVYWEHLTLVPLACATVLVLVERWTRRVPDVPDPDDPGLLCLWDSLRSAAIRTTLQASFLVLLVAYYGAASILAGVALSDPHPDWVEPTAVVVLILGAVFGVVGQLGASRNRWWFRRRLWPQFGVDGLVPFGDARHAGPAGP